jgi:outer membrane protein, heavy metal efflux system
MNTEVAALEFEDLIRQLRYQLRSSLFIIHQQERLIEKYTQQLSLLDTIVQIYDIQAGKGNIALKEAVRLKSVYLNLSNQRSAIYNNYYEELAKVQLILSIKEIVHFDFNEGSYVNFEQEIFVQDIYKEALKNRPDYKLEEKNLRLAMRYLEYQKKLGVPDINLFASYDQRGGAFNNQINAGVSMPLPVFSRNQGNVKAAGHSVKIMEYSLAGAQQKIETEILLGYNRYQVALFDFIKTRQYFSSDFDKVVNGITTNFQKRNVTLIEFVDFFESYNMALNEVARAKMQLAISAQHLNYLTSHELFKTE